MPNLTRRLGGPRLYVKRDDCTGLATGGNKTRKLEFLLGDARAQGADTLITHGAVQSNHVRQTAAAACRYGLKCEALLERRVGHGAGYETTGNVLLDRLFGARLHFVAADTDMDAACAEVAEQVRAAGGRPYVIPGGGSNAVGALGYVNAAIELLQQANDRGLQIDCVVVATGSTGTQAGLVAGLEGANSGIDALGICVRRPAEAQIEAVLRTAERHRRAPRPEGRHQFEARHGQWRLRRRRLRPAHRRPLEAIRLAAETEGLLLDPVYTGKAMAGLIDLCRKGVFHADQNVVFLHTGGSAALFGYEADLAPAS